MSEEFDPYKAWLDFDNKSASTTYYKLLGLLEFESNLDRITAAADKAIRKIRAQRPGEHLEQWSKILDELQDVKAQLLDPAKKAAYDEDLRFADEFVRELEGGVQRDPAAAAVATTTKKTESRPVKHDPRYPPGMAPKSNSPPPPAKTTIIEEIELKVGPSPKPIDRKDSPFYPPSRPTVDKAKPAATDVTPGAVVPAFPAANESDSTNDILPPGAMTPPPGATTLVATQPPAPIQQPQPTYPQAPSSHPQPGAYPPQPGYYPQQQPGYPQNYYPPPAGQAPLPAYSMPGHPVPAMPMAQSGYGYGAPLAQPIAQPMGYGAPGISGPHPGMSHLPGPMYGVPMALPMGPQTYMSPPAPGALDPMAPVAIPGTAMTGGLVSAVPLATPYGVPTTVMMSPTMAAIPIGTAVAVAGTSSPGLPPNEVSKTEVFEPAKEIRRNSATSAMQTARREKSSQQTLMIVGVSGLLLVVVALLVYSASTGSFGGGSVANKPVDNSGQNTSANSPTVQVPPVAAVRPGIPPIKPETLKPEPTKPTTPAEPEKNKLPAAKPLPEMPAETTPPLTKPTQAKPEPTIPEPAKPEPTRPEPTKPEPVKPEPKPEPPAVEVTTREELVQLGKALVSAKSAIGEFNFAEADAELAKADKLAKLPEHVSKLSRLKEVAGYVKQFHDRLVQAATGMDGGESFKIGSSTMVGMVEADQKQVILRIAGRNTPFQYSDLPVHLAAALADMKLDGTDSVSRVVKGAYVACNKASTPTQLTSAKEWWEEATLGGADVGHLMPFLTDSYDLAKDFDKLKKDGNAAKPGDKGKSGNETPGPGSKDALEP